ncbi:MAG: hypothetical protein K2P02_06300 [Lachnospiraceae bacterium]|nr:hypothetical protein [Lachnospiraceae bacterium]
MDKHESSQKWKRIAMSFFGVIVTGFCIGAFQKANLGADPFTCFVTGIANIFHSTYSTFYIIVTGALLVGVFFVEKHYIGIATVINLFFTGMAADFMRNILDNIFPAPGMAARFVMMLFGIFGTCFAASVYFTADLGVSAYDAWSLIAANKYKLMPFRLCRIASDSVCVLTGLIFHVTIGVGTVITALFMGPVVQWFNTNVSEPFLYGHKGTQ